MATEQQLTFAEHIQELRRRLMWSVLFIVIGASIGYAMHDFLLVVLQQPLHEKLYYTTPTGAFSFIIKICTVFGLIVALPMIIYQTFSFFGPLIKKRTKRQITGYVMASFLLACAGIAFAYFISLPAALKFLVNFGSETGSIEALITANEYFNFVLAYIGGYAVLFQLPLIIAFINRLTPLTPSKMFGSFRYVILGSFVAAAIITPTPDPINQAIMAGPIILLYFVTACVVSLGFVRKNRKATRRQAKMALASEPRTIRSILGSLGIEQELVPLAPRLQQALPNARPLATIPQARSRMAMDMLVVPRQQTNLYKPRPIQPRQQPKPTFVPRTEASRPTVRLISDFMPATK